ncbi:hypothetical protein QFC19_003900 [Naganishia cerealis]|uniref:Uncharacterized protein n=1 Tax=Naganishia cerealis TaxID=610337 RepID=A0ACC2W0J7_9TREE|nr:hypothetical protein QFC19_003900 [Naganishia cerealis]
MPRGRLQAVQTAARGASTSAPSARTASGSEQPHANHHSFPPATPPALVSPLVAQLRRDYRWASISQFMFTFGHAIGVENDDWDIESLEQDLDSPAQDEVVPALIVKLLYLLTYDRKIDIDNFETKLRTQYVLRDPRRNPFGKDQELSRRWNELGLSEKVQALYNCCEWQWQEPTRFRALLNSEDETLEWRIEPCGWDKSGNTYWLFDDNRLWVQHTPPTPPKPIKPIKEATVKKLSKTKTKPARGKRQAKRNLAEEDDSDEQVAPNRHAISRSNVTSNGFTRAAEVAEEDEVLQEGRSLRKRARTSAAGLTTTRSGRISRKTGQSGEASSPIAKRAKVSHIADGASPAPSGGRSTRASRRSGIVGDQWEPIPDEWLQTDPATAVKAVKGRRGKKPLRQPVMNDEDDSELSELSDVSMNPPSTDKMEESDSDLTSVSSSTLSEPEDWPGMEVAPEAASTGHDPMELGDNIGQPEEQVSHIVNSTSTLDVEEPPSPFYSVMHKDQQSPIQVDEPEKEDDLTHQMHPIAPERHEDPNTQLATSVSQPAPQNAEVIPISAPSDAKVEPKAEVAESIPSDLHMNTDESLDQGMGLQSSGDSPKTVPVQIQPASIPNAHDHTDHIVEGSSLTDPAAPKTAEEGNLSESKTVLQELAAEIEEAQEEEEGMDPKDEVRVIIRKAREPDFKEWELVCASRYEWEIFPKQFEQSKSPDEKAFYRHLVNNILPGVRIAYREKEIRKAKEDAIRNRKRSSRLVVKELERDAQRKAEESARLLEARMQRVRDEEARVQAEEADRISKEKEREDRLREREDRIREREERIRYRELEDSLAKERAERDRETRVQRRELGVSGSVSSRQGSRQPSETPSKARRGRKSQTHASSERWEVACEVCHRQGWNIDEDRPIVSCERCERWQHIDCHDRFDKKHGRPIRQWANIHFYCSECSRKIADERSFKQDSSTALAEGPASLGESRIPFTHLATKAQPAYNNTLGSSPSHKSPRITIPAYAHGRSPVLTKAQPQLLSNPVPSREGLGQLAVQTPLLPMPGPSLIDVPQSESNKLSIRPVNGSANTVVLDSTPVNHEPGVGALVNQQPSSALPPLTQHLAKPLNPSQQPAFFSHLSVGQEIQNTPILMHDNKTHLGITHGPVSTGSQAVNNGEAVHPNAVAENHHVSSA